MILPVGQSEVVRIPWVTGTLMLVCLAAFFALDGPPAVTSAPETKEQLAEASEYWREHAYLEVDPEILIEVARGVASDQRRQFLQDLKHESYQRWPDDEQVRSAQQEILDFLTTQALGRARGAEIQQTPFTRWALRPNQPRAIAFLTHPFLHGSWAQLLANLLILFLAGAALEERWGALLFIAVLPVTAVASGGASLLAAASSGALQYGAAGVVAGLVGAVLGRYWLQRIRCFYLIAIGPEGPVRGSFRVPALALLPLWLASALGQAWLPGIEAQSLYAGQLAGLIVGGLAALLIRTIHLEERLHFAAFRLAERWRALVPKRVQAKKQKPSEVSTEAPRAKDDQGLADLQEAAHASPGDVGAVRAFWEAAVAAGQPKLAAPDMLRLVHQCAHRGENDAAARNWIEVTNTVPNALAYPTLLVRLVPALLAMGESEQAKKAIRQAIHPANRGLTVQNAVRAVQHARELDESLARSAAQRALELPDLPVDARAALEAVVAGRLSLADPQSSAARAGPGTPPTQPPSEPGAGAAPGGPGTSQAAPPPRPAAAAPAPSPGGPRFPGAKIVEGTPSRLAESGLFIKVAADRMIELKYARVEALAAAMVVRSLGQSPEVVIDLALNWNQPGEPLRIVRLRSDGFDPRGLVGPAANLEDAYRMLLDKLLTLTRAIPLPDEESARGRPMRVFSDLESYQQEVLELES